LHLSIIIPVYNERERLSAGLKGLREYLQLQSFDWEIVIVNDGSIDDTLEQLHTFQKEIPMKIETYPINRGKGHAIKRGMLAASGKFRLFMDIDLSTAPREFDKFSSLLEKHDVIIGSRRLSEESLVVRQPKLRESLGRIFTKLSKSILLLKVSDFTCGFKCFSEKAAKEIFSRAQIDRWSFDSEILYISKKLGYPIKEVPVQWKNDTHTKVRVLRDGINSFKELIQIRLNDAAGKYD
jgi:dolichyl-phosphate beta-glucosyltransferase